MKVIGLGDNVVDHYVYKNCKYLGGNAVNFSVFASQLGAESAFLGFFGSDVDGEFATATLNDLSVDTSHCKTLAGENGYSIVDLEKGDRVFKGSNKGGVLRIRPKLSKEDLEYINTFDLAHLSINGNMDTEISLIKVPVIYDFSDYFDESAIDLVANQIELACFSVSEMSEEKIEHLCKRVVNKGIPYVLCSMGARGAVFYSNDIGFIWQDANHVDVIDTMGAGDSLITAFAVTFFESTDRSLLKAKLAMKRAIDYATRQTQIEGSFGGGIAIN